jgi:flagellar biosynthetic protein FlhB
MAEHNGEKSQDPTPHRRRQAREEGQVARSQDLSSAGLLLGGLVVLFFTGGALLDFLAGLLTSYLGGEPRMAWVRSGQPAGGEAIASQWNALVGGLAKVLLPLIALVTLLSIVINVAQTGWLFLPRKAAPDFSRVNPLAGLGRMFSPAGGARLGFGIFKIGVIGAVAFVSLYHRRDELVSLSALDLPQIAAFAWQICLWTCVKIGLALLVLAILDYGFQRWKHEQDLKMTPQEVREEMRNLQGDPQIIARRRGVQLQLALSRLSHAVPKADVVIANSSGLAVALRFEANSMRAPIVVARGIGLVAQRIRHLAVENAVAVVEKDVLAQALYDEVDLNRAIPDGLYAPVAEVLAYAYQLTNKTLPSAA